MKCVVSLAAMGCECCEVHIYTFADCEEGRSANAQPQNSGIKSPDFGKPFLLRASGFCEIFPEIRELLWGDLIAILIHGGL